MRRLSGLRAFVIVVTAAMLVPALPGPSGAAGSGCAGAHRTGHWSTIEPPVPPDPAATPQFLRFAADTRGTLFASPDNRTLFRSKNGGCSWTPVLDLADARGAGSGAARPTIASLLVGSSRRTEIVYV